MGTTRYRYLADVINEQGWTLGAEIGVYRGEMLFWVLDHCPKVSIIAVDAWMALPDGCPTYEDWDHAGNERTVRKEARIYDPGRVRILKATSQYAARGIMDASLDFVFIDADHRTEAVRADIKAWSPKVRRDGWIMGHDYTWESVRTAVDEAFPEVRRGRDSVWYEIQG